MAKTVLLNGPKRSGKSTICKYICSASQTAAICNSSDRLKMGTHFSLNTPMKHADAYEAVKDTSMKEFYGLTPRQAYIIHSEKYLKPNYGREIFGHFFVQDCLNIKRSVDDEVWDKLIILNESLGFPEELDPILNEFSPNDVIIVNVTRNDEYYEAGMVYPDDSRMHITQTPAHLPDVRTYNIGNSKDLPRLMESADSLMRYIEECE